MNKEQVLLAAMSDAYWITVQRQPDGKEIFSGNGPDFVKWGDVEIACEVVKLDSLRSTITTLQSRLEESEAVIGQLNIFLNSERSTVELYKSRLEAAEGENGRLKEAVDTLSQRCGFPIVLDRVQVLRTIGNRVEHQERLLEAGRIDEEKYKSLQDDLAAAESRAQQAEQSLAELTESTTALQQNYHKVMEDREKGLEEIARREMELRRVERERDGLWKKIHEAQARAERAEGLLKEWVRLCRETECEYDDVQPRLSATESFLALTPAPQGRTDGERFTSSGHECDLCEGSGEEGKL